MKRKFYIVVIFLFTIASCNIPSQTSSPSTTTPPKSIETNTDIPPATTPSPTSTPKPIDITHQPLYWFAPLPPQINAYNGSDDFMKLFEPDAPWTSAAGYIQVFKFYGGWAGSDSSEKQLRQAIEAVRQRGFALAVEMGPLNPTDDCGVYIEGFAGEGGIESLKRIKAMGGDLNFIAFDEPYYYGHFYDGEQACNWTAEKIAKDIDSFIQRARAIFPNVMIGDIEPVTGPADAKAYNEWLDIFREVNGYDLAFLHLDIDWSDTRWPQKVKAIVEHGREIGVPIGVIYNGNPQDKTDEAWLSIAGERIKNYEVENEGDIDHIIFQSWNDKPDRVLPESELYTYTGFLKTYFENRSALGFQLTDTANVALKKTVRVSRFNEGYGGASAVDGDPGTSWSSGDDAPQWIEIDLGEPYDIREIRLLPSQYPAGATYHRVRGKGPGTGGNFVELYIFNGETEDAKWLIYTASDPWLGIQFIRIESAASPSWIAWREIEILR